MRQCVESAESIKYEKEIFFNNIPTMLDKPKFNPSGPGALELSQLQTATSISSFEKGTCRETGDATA